MLRSGVLARVLERAGGARIVLMSPLVADAAFTREFAHPRVVFEELPAHVPRGLEARLLGLIQARYLEMRTTETLRIKLAANHAGTALRYRRAKAALGRIVAPRGASTLEPIPGPKSREIRRLGRQDLAGFRSEVLALRGASILVVPPASTNAGCGETWRTLL